ncbi:MAG: STAS domain-containing protein [Phycisphaerales bacterium]|jgi:anti-sigma B factor antagonist|nr:STAS domain-containing protein [Phycisphaerales bacterium]
MSQEFKHVRVRHDGGVVEARLLDRHILDELVIREIGEEVDRVVADAPSPSMILDFADVEHLSSSALGMLITLNSRLQDREGGLCMINVCDSICEVFRITRLDKVLSMAEDYASARAELLGDA